MRSVACVRGASMKTKVSSHDACMLLALCVIEVEHAQRQGLRLATTRREVVKGKSKKGDGPSCPCVARQGLGQHAPTSREGLVAINVTLA